MEICIPIAMWQSQITNTFCRVELLKLSLLSILRSDTEQVLTMSSNSPNYVMKSNVGDGFDERGPCQTELNSNFADLKPSRPSFYKKEFKKCRESLQMNGEVKWNNISNEISNK